MFFFVFFFFFSSRRRHTRCGRDWSSDVCSSDLPAWQVLEGSLDPGRIAGSIVLVGTGAAGLRDVGATPLDPVASGVTVHATVIEQILLGQFLERPDWATGAELVYLAGLGLLLALLIPRLGAIGTALLGL